MNRIFYILAIAVSFGLALPQAFAGNPDRQGEAGAYELLINPWARSAGLHTMTTSCITGVEAMRLNVAGVGRVDGLQFYGAHSIYLESTGININSFGFATPIGKSGGIGVTIMAMDFGDIPITTTNQPEGTGATFSPTFLNIGVGYSHVFENKVSVGILFRGVSERIADLSASTFAIDAGVQYVTGENDNFKFGISLRNVGGSMQFTGEGLTINRQVPIGSVNYGQAVEQRSAEYELQSQLNIGASYDFLLGTTGRLTLVGNFASNAFSQDQLGGGLEFGFLDILVLRGGYKYEFGSNLENGKEAPLYTGIAAGVTIEVPFKKDNPESGRFGVDYAYRTTKLFGGTHNIGVRLDL
ncbi:MAG: PorV/PorQ family protein [Saprospiraceae bacterium]|nr:PorV/PorQ family protein [Saprospiraceae bacterium]